MVILNLLSVPTHTGNVSNLIMVVPLRVDACDLPSSCLSCGDSDGYSFPFCELLLRARGLCLLQILLLSLGLAVRYLFLQRNFFPPCCLFCYLLVEHHHYFLIMIFLFSGPRKSRMLPQNFLLILVPELNSPKFLGEAVYH